MSLLLIGIGPVVRLDARNRRARIRESTAIPEVEGRLRTDAANGKAGHPAAAVFPGSDVMWTDGFEPH